VPLRRRPKQLDVEPMVFDARGGSASGTVLRARPGGTGTGRARPTGIGSGFTDERGELVMAEQSTAPDPVARQRAREIAARLSLAKPRQVAGSHRGGGRFSSVAYRDGSDDIDLDRTLEALAEKPVPEDDDIIVRERIRAPRSVVLAVDLSGSMKGERLRTAAATVGALSAELEQDALALIAFWSDAAILLQLGDPIHPLELLDTMLRMPARGLTNVAFPLQLAAQQLAGVLARDARVVLLSDCVHNAGPDPRPFAARLPRLDVLLDTTGEKDVELGRELARIGRGSFRPVRSYLEVAPALSEMFRT
jgi:Mg-chelatase subunit ChlD